MKKRVSKKEFFIMAFFFTFVTIYDYLVVTYGMGNDISNWRYYVFMGAIILSFLVFLFTNKKKLHKTKGKEVTYMIITALIFLAVSLYESHTANVEMPFRVLVQISLFLLPCLLAFTLNNTLSKNALIVLLKGLTFISIFFYFTEARHTPLQFLNFDNYANISFIGSKSFTESHAFFDSFLELFFTFNFLEQTAENESEKKTLHKFTILTFTFTLMCFKRLGVLFAIGVFLFRHKINYIKRSRLDIWVWPTVFTVLTILYTLVMQGKLLNLTYDQIFDLTSGRNWILSLWEQKHYISYGFGTSMLFIGRYLEMDLVEIYLEMGLICLFIFSFSWFKMTGNNHYANLVMVYAFLNFLTSSSLPWSIGYIVLFMNVINIASTVMQKDKMLASKKMEALHE